MSAPETDEPGRGATTSPTAATSPAGDSAGTAASGDVNAATAAVSTGPAAIPAESGPEAAASAAPSADVASDSHSAVPALSAQPGEREASAQPEPAVVRPEGSTPSTNTAPAPAAAKTETPATNTAANTAPNAGAPAATTSGSQSTTAAPTGSEKPPAAAGASRDGIAAVSTSSRQPVVRADSLSVRDTLPLAQPQGLASRLRDRNSFDGAADETGESPLAPFLSPASMLEQSGEVSGWGSLLMRQRSSFFRQVFLWLLAISLLMSVGSGAIYYSRQLTFAAEDREQRAELLLGYLATQSELGAFAGDRVLLDGPMRRMADLQDIAYVAVYDGSGHELSSTGTRSGQPPPEPPPGLINELLRRARQETEVSQPRSNIFMQSVSRLRHQIQNEKLNCLDLYAPIVTSEHGPPGVTAFLYPSDRLGRDRVVGVARVGLSLVAANERLNEVARWGAGLGLLLLVLGATAAYFIAGRISVPILELARGADEIRNGNLHPRINVNRSDELGMLAESFVRMAERLRETMSALSRLNRDLESEIKRRTRQIRLAYAFTSVLNSPIDRSDEVMDAADLTVMLDQALSALVEATGTKGGGVFLIDDNNPDGELLVRAASGVSTHSLGPAPSLKDFMAGRPKNPDGSFVALTEAVQVVNRRLLVPLVFRNHPLGLLVLLLSGDEIPDPALVEFVRQAAAQLAIAVSNARAYTRLTQLASELRQRNEALATQRDRVRAQRDQLAEQRNQLEEQRNQLAAQSIQLRIQRNQLRDVNRLKSEFLANVSHELRTPLNAIMGYSELIHDQIYGPISVDAQDAIAGVLASSSNLLRLINQILDLSRIEAGRMEVYFEKLNLHSLVTAVIREAEAMGRDRPYKVQLCCPADLQVHSDAVKLQQILTNLIANAIKFTSQGTVIVDVRGGDGADDFIYIAVKDTGIGIRAEHLELIFEEFRQVDGSSTRRYGGTGLGLAIARRLAEMLGATLTVESTYGIGSTFTIRLPRTPPTRSPRGRNREGDSNPALSMSDPEIPRLIMAAAAAAGDSSLADAAIRHHTPLPMENPRFSSIRPGATGPTPAELAAEPTPLPMLRPELPGDGS
jgi:signal transduction histidine kinase